MFGKTIASMYDTANNGISCNNFFSKFLDELVSLRTIHKIINEIYYCIISDRNRIIIGYIRINYILF